MNAVGRPLHAPRCTARPADVWCVAGQTPLPKLAIHEQLAGRSARGHGERKQETQMSFTKPKAVRASSSSAPQSPLCCCLKKPGSHPARNPGNAAWQSLYTPFSTRAQYYKAAAAPEGGNPGRIWPLHVILLPWPHSQRNIPSDT